MEKDISGILKGWDHVPDELSVRKIQGSDGKPKIQLRLDLGLLQMELDGRPDGTRPFGAESLLDYYEALLDRRRARGTLDEDFTLDDDDCLLIQQEAIQYYHRYLCLFQLEDFERVARDTARNLRVFDLVKRYAGHDEHKWALDQYRPYVLMMNTRAVSLISLSKGREGAAAEQVEEGIALIEEFYREYGIPEQIETSEELSVLRDWLTQVSRPPAPNVRQRLEERLRSAVEREAYEEAAKLRDRLLRLKAAVSRRP